MDGASDENDKRFTDEEQEEDDDTSDDIVDDIESVKFNNGGRYSVGGEAEIILVNDERTSGVEEAEEEERPIRRCLCCVCCHSKSKGKKDGDKNKVSKNDKKVKKQASQVRNMSKSQKRKEMCWLCCKKFTAFLFSHIGLCGLVIAYSIMGGFVFMSLEASHEKLEREGVDLTRRSKVERLWNITEYSLILGKKNWTHEVDKVLKEFQTEIFEATKLRGWDGQSEDADAQWSFPNSLLYSITVITTIGKMVWFFLLYPTDCWIVCRCNYITVNIKWSIPHGNLRYFLRFNFLRWRLNRRIFQKIAPCSKIQIYGTKSFY